jgi:DNA-binding transcriptional ArsR family regulator
MDIVQLAKDVERKKLEYDKAVRALAEALGPSSFSAPKVERRRGPRTGPSVAQRVLELVKADPDGVTRGQLLEVLKAPGAIHSALKKFRAEGLIEPVGQGRWRAKGKKGKAGAAAPAP